MHDKLPVDPETVTFEIAADFLSRTGWLSELPASSREEILGACRLVKFEADTTVYHMGDVADGLYGFVHPGLQIFLPGEDGEAVMVHLTEPGFWSGDSAYFAQKTRLVSMVTTRPTAALHIGQARLRDLVERAPGLYHDFYTLSHRNLATTLRLLANLAVSRSDRRIALRLMHYDSQSSVRGDWLKLTQEDLTRLVAVSLPTVQRALRKFSEEGAVELGYRKLRVLDRTKLIELCDND